MFLSVVTIQQFLPTAGASGCSDINSCLFLMIITQNKTKCLHIKCLPIKFHLIVYYLLSWLDLWLIHHWFLLLSALIILTAAFPFLFFLLNLLLGAFPVAYDAVSDVLASCQLAAFLEVVHPLIGIVKTGVMAPFMQVCIVTIKS